MIPIAPQPYNFKAKLVPCPFNYKRINPETGYVHAGGADQNVKDDRSRIMCPIGKGPWCPKCQHYNQSKISNEKWLRIFNGIKAKGKAPHLWK